MSDYKRRVSSTATVEASYDLRAYSPDESHHSRRRRRCRRHGSVSDENSLGILGLAAGGQMYGARDLRLLIVSLIS